MGKEAVYGLIEESSKRGLEQAAERLQMGTTKKSVGALIQEVGNQLARELEAVGDGPVTVTVTLQPAAEAAA